MEEDVLTTGQILKDLLGNSVTRSFVEGVYALNELSPFPLKNRPALVVCNTAAQYSNSDGEHWVAFFVGREGVEYFDSYGLPPADPSLEQFAATNGGLFGYNSTCLQGFLATTCGKYVTTYLYYRSLGYTLAQYLELFGSDADECVREMYSRIFGRGRCSRGQKCHSLGYKCGGV